MLPTRLLAPVLAALAVTGLPAAAHASMVSLEGDALVVRAAPGEANRFSIGPSDEQPGRLQISDTMASGPAADPSVCTQDYLYFVSCVAPPGGVRFEAGDRDDQLNMNEHLPAGLVVTFDGGAGNDVLRGAPYTETTDVLIGGPGNDTLTGGMGADTIDGGPGDDEIDGRDGPDAIHAGEGNDKLMADDWSEQSTDVIDGGPGYDQIHNNWVSKSGDFQPPITVSVDGVANDGRPGENDNLTGVENIYLNAPASLTGSDGADELTVFNTDGPSTLNGRGGDDKLSGFDLDDTIDGGAGNDVIEGGYGHDTITGSPGRDVINGDVNGATCHWIQCRSPYGNDRIDARDGEIDNITCGVGEDVVEADPADTVAPDCETVNRAAASPGPSRGQIAPAGGPSAVSGGASLRGLHARRTGRTIVVTGQASGARRVAVRAVLGARTVAKTTAPVRAGRFRARLRAPRKVRVIVTAGSLKRALTVR